MAVLGVGGIVRLRRELPEPVVLPSSALSLASYSVVLRDPAYWTGDLVTLVNTAGLPFDAEGTGPGCPDGYAMYAGSDWLLGANKSHLTSDSSSYYTQNDSANFYQSAEAVELNTKAWYYIYRDQLDRISFYTSRAAAMAGTPGSRIPLKNVDFGSMILSLAGSNDYETALMKCVVALGEWNQADIRDEVTLKSLCELDPNSPALIPGTEDYNNASVKPAYALDVNEYGQAWNTQGYLQNWSLSLSAPEVETTSVGERFGDAVKSVINGGGSMDFLVERSDLADNKQDSTALMRLLMMVDKGCKAEAQFWMIKGRKSTDPLLPGDLYYETQLMVTSVAINTRPDDIIAGSLNFVTVGEIALRMGQN